MGFYDDLRVRLEQEAQKVGNDLRQYLESQVRDPLVRVGEAAKGNLTAAQLRSGETGEAKPVAQSQTLAEQAAPYVVPPLFLIAAGIAAYFYFSGGKK